MNNLLNKIYDFFAFSLPGACVIIVVLLFPPYGKTIYQSLPWTGEGLLYELLILAIAGYLIGYIITPLTRFLILKKTAVPLTEKYYGWIKRGKKAKQTAIPIITELNELKGFLKINNHSEDFVKVRENAPLSSQYIEYWDMHTTMASNLAFASALMVVFQFINLVKDNESVFAIKPGWWILMGISAFFLLLNITIKYSRWWMSDIRAASKWSEKRYN